jgi:uncharacterized phiE125 gp8 family phage protein
VIDMALETLVAPAIEPVTLAEARAFLRIGTDGDDGVLTRLLIAAREALEARTGRALVTRTVRQRFVGPRRLQLGLPGTLLPGRVPATSIVAVRTIGADGSETVVPLNSVQIVDGRFVLNTPLSSNIQGLSIDYLAGYGSTAASVPEAFKVSILEAVADALVRRDNGIGDGGQSWEQAFAEVKL